ncbi:unnamed protein product [Linum tenue]|uniref:Uncharacterized protein n=1 Tax=Linum tenue TaxID=586396 RepID=A0AAV0I8S4_9ROSI|nr:unnamed protein product [Linum tenue]CAI0426665.1 unnamed protein product [Linum tenue]
MQRRKQQQRQPESSPVSSVQENSTALRLWAATKTLTRRRGTQPGRPKEHHRNTPPPRRPRLWFSLRQPTTWELRMQPACSAVLRPPPPPTTTIANSRAVSEQMGAGQGSTAWCFTAGGCTVSSSSSSRRKTNRASRIGRGAQGAAARRVITSSRRINCVICQSLSVAIRVPRRRLIIRIKTLICRSICEEGFNGRKHPFFHSFK